MKLPELKTAIANHSREDLQSLVAELYKLVPKAKKEDSQIDELIANPKSLSEKPKAAAGISHATRPLDTIRMEVLAFVEHADQEYYLVPNRVVPKAQRSKWRFMVKNWFKELTAAARYRENIPTAADLLQKLYELLCRACSYSIFTTDMPFQSVGIGQSQFFGAVLALNIQCQDKPVFAKNAIRLIIDNEVHYDMLPSNLMMVLIEMLDTEEGMRLVIEQAHRLRPEVEAGRKKRTNYSSIYDHDYRTDEKLNNLTDIVFSCHAHLEEFGEAVAYFQQYHLEKDNEIKLYILARLLFAYQQPEWVVKVIEEGESKGLAPRKKLLELKEHISREGDLPRYFG